MIVFFDTSALVKLYVHEAGSSFIRQYVQSCSAALVSVVAYPEGRAALARVFRAGSLTVTDYEAAKRRLEGDWGRLVVLPAATSTLRLAGDLAEQHKLRGIDAVHLASAVVARQTGTVGPIAFATWDRQLLTAAGAEQFAVVGGSP
jgi:predicted nucleic acid-binding protein